MVLSGFEIKKMIKEARLVRDFIDLDTQLTPNGFDLTAGEIFSFQECGALDFSNKERAIPRGKEITAKKRKGSDKFGWWHLEKGIYKVRTNETVSLPNNLVALAFSRSSLLRIGAFAQTAVWDRGFTGRSEFALVIENPKGARIKQNARLIQLVFVKTGKKGKSYCGIYQEKKG